MLNAQMTGSSLKRTRIDGACVDCLLAVAMVSNPWKPKKQLAAPVTTPDIPNGMNPPVPHLERRLGGTSSIVMFQLCMSAVTKETETHYFFNIFKPFFSRIATLYIIAADRKQSATASRWNELITERDKTGRQKNKDLPRNTPHVTT